MAAPILVEFGVPLIAAHMFVFFFGILADVTPPVCLAAFAGAGIARSNPLKTGVTALRLAVAGFLIPYVFVLQPALLLQSNWHEIPIPLLTLIAGMIAVAAGLAGYGLIRATVLERILLIAGGVGLVYPDPIVSLVGLAVVAVAVVLQFSRRRIQQRQASESAAPEISSDDGAHDDGTQRENQVAASSAGDETLEHPTAGDAGAGSDPDVVTTIDAPDTEGPHR